MIPLEDNAADIVGKAQRGLGISDSELADGAPFKRSAVPDYGGLRHKPRESYICCCRSWLCREPALIGSYGGIGCDLHGSDR